MPIRPEMLPFYPEDWRAISDYIRFDRALGRCECEMECGSLLHQAWAWTAVYTSRGAGISLRCPNYHGERSRFTGSIVVLTTAHLAHDPRNSEADDLKAMCQACHLAYDADHHAQTRAGRG